MSSTDRARRTIRRARTEEAAVERLLTIAQVARMAGFSERAVYRHVEKGALQIVRVGPFRRPRVRLSDARRYAGLA